jgi:hypothetical protein
LAPHRAGHWQKQERFTVLRNHHWRCIALALFLSTLPLLGHTEAPALGPVPRIIIALYDARDGAPLATEIHRHAEMPLNHLGLVVEYHDLNEPLPPLDSRPDVRGILVWQRSPSVMRPDRYLRWLESALRAGKRFVSLGDIVGVRDHVGQYQSLAALNQVLRQIGVRLKAAEPVVVTRARVAFGDEKLVGFERAVLPPLPFFLPTEIVGEGVAGLSIATSSQAPGQADVLITSPRGGYIAAGFALYRGATAAQRQWIVDPFEFLRRAFATDDLPKPDTTTLSGRRIYYSHIDGDGWRNISLVDDYVAARVMSAEVILERAIRPYPDLPVTVAPIAGELDLNWYGSAETRHIARQMFLLPQVEVASHTYSHPFSWGFFENYVATKEQALLPRYAKLRGGQTRGWGELGVLSPDTRAAPAATFDANFVPRAFAIKPFDLQHEVTGAVDMIEQLVPAHKRVRVLQWSGDTAPFEAALAATEQAGLANINGGDSRFDEDFPSYAFVAPVGRQVGKYWQIYASNSNENTYTDLWRGRFYGFRFLDETFLRTESPRRVRAANVYYHMYSGERLASLNALLQHLDWARAAELAPIETSRYASLAAGFYAAHIELIGAHQWQITERGALNTIRFDAAADVTIDWARCAGVVGARRYQGSLYVALDEHTAATIVALSTSARTDPESAPIYLRHSRWRVYDCALGTQQTTCLGEGYGIGEMTWQARPQSNYEVRLPHDAAGEEVMRVRADEHGTLKFSLPIFNSGAVRFSVNAAAHGREE